MEKIIIDASNRLGIQPLLDSLRDLVVLTLLRLTTNALFSVKRRLRRADAVNGTAVCHCQNPRHRGSA